MGVLKKKLKHKMQNIDVQTMARFHLITMINIFLCGLIILNVNNGVSEAIEITEMSSSITTSEENLAAADNIGITTEKIMVTTEKSPEIITTVATEDDIGITVKNVDVTTKKAPEIITTVATEDDIDITAENGEVTTQEAPEITTTEGPMIFVLDMDIDIDDIGNTTEKVIVTTEEVPEITTNEKEATTTEKSPEIEFTTPDTSTKLRTEIRQPKQLETAGASYVYSIISTNVTAKNNKNEANGYNTIISLPYLKEKCLPIYNAKGFVQGLSNQYKNLIIDKNVKGILELHTSKSVALPFATVGRLLDTKEDFQRYFVTPLTKFGIKSLTTDSVVQQGCVLHEVGTIMSLGSYYKAIIGQYYNRWNREGGKWKIEFENILFPR